ncbi:MAG: ribonuclease HI family protein [bacterium]|nr:ribonuclease HI family protein [bacterium]
MTSYETYTDGGARGNPGPAGIGAVVVHKKSGKRYHFKRYIGVTTNNQAEYRALLLALEKVREMGGTEVECFMDSELVCKQLKREYRVKNPDLAPLFLKIWNLSTEFEKIRYTHIRREKNKEADALVNEALDEHIQQGNGH